MGKPVRLVFIGDDKQLTAALGRVTRNAAATNTALQKMTKTGADMTRVGRSMTLGVTLPVVAAGAAAVKLSTDFEESMTHIQSLVGVSKKQVSQWGDEILKLAPKVGKGPKELAEALYFITSSGVPASRAMEVLGASAKAAAAGLGETKDVANLVTSVMNAYGRSAGSATKITDILTRAVAAGKAEPKEFANALGSVISISAELGVKFDDVAASVAQISLTGDNAATATTKLRGALVKILKPTQQGSSLLAAMGTSTGELRKSIASKGLLPTIQGLYKQIQNFSSLSKQQKIELLGGKTLKNLTAAQRILVENDFGRNLGAMFNDVRGLQGVLKAAGAAKGDVEGVFKAVKSGAGGVNQAFGVQTQTSAQKFKKALAGLQASGIQIGQILTPYVLKLVDAVTKLASSFANASPETKKMVLQLLAMAAAIGPLVWGFGSMLKIFTRIAQHPILTVIGLLILGFIHLYTHSAKFRAAVTQVGHALVATGKWIAQHRVLLMALGGAFATFYTVAKVGSIVKQFAMFSSVMGGPVKGIRALLGIGPKLGKMFKAVQVAWRALSASFLFSPIGLVIAAIAALVVAFIIAYKKSETFRKIVNNVLHAVGAAALWLWKFIKPVLMAIGHFFAVIWKAISDTVSRNWGTIKKVLMVIGAVIAGPVIGAIWLLKKVWSAVGGPIMAVVRFLGKMIAFNFRMMIVGIKALVWFVRNVLFPIFRAWWAVTAPVLQIAWTVIKAVFTAIWIVISTAAKLIWIALTTAFKVAWIFIKPLILGMWITIKAVFTAIVAVAKWLWSNWVASFNLIKSLVTSVWNWIYNNIVSKIIAIHNKVMVYMTAIVSVITDRFNAVKTRIGNIWGAISAAVSGAWSKVVGFVSRFVQVGEDIVNGIVTGIKNAAGKVVDAAKSLGEKIPNTVQKVLGIKSPSREMIRLMRFVVLGMVQGLSQSNTTTKVRAATTKLANLVIAGVKNVTKRNQILKVIDTGNKQLQKLAARRANVAVQLGAAQKKLTAALNQRNAAAASYKAKILDDFKLIGTNSAGKAESATQLLKRITKEAANTVEFGQLISQLKSKGLNTTLLSQLTEAGPAEGLQTARNLLKNNGNLVGDINAQYAKMATAATNTGNQMADAMYGAGVQAAQGVVNGLKSQQKAIENQMMTIAKGMQSAIKKALGIKSPSRVMANIAKFIPAGIGVGVTEGSGTAMAAMSKLGDKMVGAFASPGLSLGLERAATAVRGASQGGGGNGTTTIDRSRTMHLTVHGANASAQDIANEVEWQWRTAAS